MKLTNEMEPIRNWAKEKGIYDSGDLKTQTIKLLEECGELGKAVINDDKNEIIDAIGDCVIVLTSIAKLYSIHYNHEIKIEDCINIAYNVISKRNGYMKNGTFVKNK